MPRKTLPTNVFDEALNRLLPLYEGGHRVAVSFSAGKDSGVCLELCIMAARQTGRLPVDVVMRDEEIMLPGTFEYAERTAARPEVNFHWLVANQPVINVYNRRHPYFWVFDPLLAPSKWVRQPPSFAEYIPELNIESICTPTRFPPDEGKTLFSIIGLRTSESNARLLGLHASRGYVTKPVSTGERNVRPIYDWTDNDVWTAIHQMGWDYNHAYDVLVKMGVRKNGLRIAPPTLNAHGADTLRAASKAWPAWFGRVCERLPGVRAGAHFGKRALMPIRAPGETWQQCFMRECIKNAPEWIRERSQRMMVSELRNHANHSETPYPDVTHCNWCQPNGGCWRKLCQNMYGGDPFSLKFSKLPIIEPEFFRPGSGTWGGNPAFA